MKEKIELSAAEYIIVRIGEQLFGIPVNHVVDVLLPQKINLIPLTRKEILGSLNLRGRIVTVLDIRFLLEIKEVLNTSKSRFVVIEYQDELYSLVVDSVSEVLNLDGKQLLKNPDNLTKFWNNISKGIFPLESELVIILDIDKVISILME